jgi:hypothetical protein
VDRKQHHALDELDYQRYKLHRELAKHVPLDTDDDDDTAGHARIYGRDTGGIIVEHHYPDGRIETHPFARHQHAEAIDHLHGLVADDFIGKEEPSKGESNE